MVKTTVTTKSGTIYEIEQGVFGHKILRNNERLVGYIWPTRQARGVDIDKEGRILGIEKEFKKGLYVLVWNADKMEFMNSTEIVSVVKGK